MSADDDIRRMRLGLCDGCPELSWYTTDDSGQGRALVCRRMSTRISRSNGYEDAERFAPARASEATKHDEEYLALYFVESDCERIDDYRSLRRLREL